VSLNISTGKKKKKRKKIHKLTDITHLVLKNKINRNCWEEFQLLKYFNDLQWRDNSDYIKSRYHIRSRFTLATTECSRARSEGTGGTPRHRTQGPQRRFIQPPTTQGLCPGNWWEAMACTKACNQLTVFSVPGDTSYTELQTLLPYSPRMRPTMELR
jgi:hypothetical protein